MTRKILIQVWNMTNNKCPNDTGIHFKMPYQKFSAQMMAFWNRNIRPDNSN